jgi:CRP-like cAMP-binding protein
MFNVIASLNLFQNIHPDTLAAINSSAKIKSFKKGTFLNAEPDNAYLYYILKGHVKYFKETQDGQETVIDVLSTSHFLGENLCFNRDYKRHHTQCINTVELMMWPIPTIRKLLHADHQLSLNFLEQKIQEQCRFESHIEGLTTHSAEQRVADLLLKLYNTKEGVVDSKAAVKAPLSTRRKIILKLPYGKSLMAARLNMRPETFTRVLQKVGAQCQMKVMGSMLYVDSLVPLTKTLSDYLT